MKTLIFLLTLILATAQAGAAVIGFGGGTHTSLASAIAAGSNGDTFLCLQNYTDPMTTGINTALTGCTLDFGEHTALFPDCTPNTVPVLKITGSGWTVKNGVMQVVTAPPLWLYGTTAIIEDVEFEIEGALGYEAFLFGSGTTSVSFSRCKFSRDIGEQDSRYIISDTRGINLTLTDCFFSGGSGHVYVAVSAADLVVTRCEFEKVHWRALRLTLGGVATITESTFEKDGQYTTEAVLVETPAGVHEILIDGCTFTNTKLVCEASGNVAQGSGLTIQDCTFNGGEAAAALVRTNDAIISGCTFYGGLDENWHGLLLGSDSGYDVGDTTAADSPTVYDCTWNLTIMPPSSTGGAYLPIVCKTNGLNFYDNEITYSAAPPAGLTEMCFISLRSASEADIHNNTFTGNDADIQAIRLSSQTASDSCDVIVIANNKVLGTYESAVHYQQWAGMASDHNISVASNYWASGTIFSDSDAGQSDATEETWWGTFNTTDSESWYLKWAGLTGLTGISGTPEGFVEMGLNPTISDPIVGHQQLGFTTPIEALARCRELGLEGVELSMTSSIADSMNLNIWLWDVHPASGAATWATHATDTTRIIGVLAP
jgi:hypothetical protein